MPLVASILPAPERLVPVPINDAKTVAPNVSVLEVVNAENLVGLLISINQAAGEIFNVFEGLHSELKQSSQRITHLKHRSEQLYSHISTMPDSQVMQYRYGRKIETPVRESGFVPESRDYAVKALYKQAQTMPNFAMFDVFSTDNIPCASKYCNPRFFFESWLAAEQARQEERMKRKGKKKPKATKEKSKQAKVEAQKVKVTQFNPLGAEFGPAVTLSATPMSRPPSNMSTPSPSASNSQQSQNASAAPVPYHYETIHRPRQSLTESINISTSESYGASSSSISSTSNQFVPPPPPNMMGSARNSALGAQYPGYIPTPPSSSSSFSAGSAGPNIPAPPPPAPGFASAPPASAIPFIPAAPAVPFIPIAPPVPIEDSGMENEDSSSGPSSSSTSSSSSPSSLDASRAGLLGAITAGNFQLKKVTPAPPKANDPRQNMLTQIRAGRELRHVDVNARPPPAAAATAASASGLGLGGAVAALLARRAAIKGSESESEESDGWED